MGTTLNRQDVLSLLTGRTPSKINRLLDSYLKQNAVVVTKEQWSILAVLWEQEGRTQQELADATFRDRAGTTRLLDQLEKEGFIERKHHRDDRRINLIYLTEKGKQCETTIVAALKQLVDQITSGVQDEDLLCLRNVLEKINQNIDSIQTQK